MDSRPAATADWYRLDTAEVLEELGTNAEDGLPEPEAARRLAEVGPNELVEQARRSPWRILGEQFTSPITLILIASAIISAILGDLRDTIAIAAVVVLFAVLGFIQEYRAERAIAALRRLAVPLVRVTRGGRLRDVSAAELAPGDIISLETGNLVPADARLLEAANLRIQEAALTGESEPMEKTVEALGGPELPLGDRRNIAYAGTLVTYGRARAAVVATGMRTEIGRIAAMLQAVQPEETTLQRRLAKLGRQLALIGVAVAAAVLISGLLRGESINLVLLTAVSIAVAIIPEGLPAVVTITLALGAQRMLKRHALIRRLPAVETLGSVTVICSDKTGTLTENRMTVVALDVAGDRVDLSESLRHRAPTFSPQDGCLVVEGTASPLAALLICGALANDARLQQGGEPGEFHAFGDPTDGALVVAAARMGLWQSDLEKALPRVAEWPFDSERKRMTTAHAVPDPQAPSPVAAALGLEGVPAVACTKGSLEGLLAISSRVWVGGRAEPLTADWRARLEAANASLASQGMRVLGAGFRPLTSVEAEEPAARVEQDLTIVGLFGLIDPPRPEVEEAVSTCKSAGMRPVMITGDQPLTAREIARQLGITEDGDLLTGQDLNRLSVEELRDLAGNVSVYARVSPADKLKIVQALQERGEVVAMTGDGVNDAPALKRADIGVAMGITGTDVAKEASSMILLDDNFSTIVAAAREGRVIFDNIRKYLRFSIAGNIGKVLVVLLAPILAIPLPLLPLQILWLNLLTDGLLGLGLGVEPAERDIMRRPPYSPAENIFGRGIGRHIAWVGLLTGALAIGVGYLYWTSGRASWQTMIFTSIAFIQVGHAVAANTFRTPIFAAGQPLNALLWAMAGLVFVAQLAAIYVPGLQNALRTVPLSAGDLAITLGLGAVMVAAVELEKRLIIRNDALRQERP